MHQVELGHVGQEVSLDHKGRQEHQGHVVSEVKMVLLVQMVDQEKEDNPVHPDPVGRRDHLDREVSLDLRDQEDHEVNLGQMDNVVNLEPEVSLVLMVQMVVLGKEASLERQVDLDHRAQVANLDFLDPKVSVVNPDKEASQELLETQVRG